MVRTGDRCVRVGGGKSSSKKSGGRGDSGVTSKSKASSGKSNSSIGGNPVCPRETPEWQKPITSFFLKTNAQSSTVVNQEQNEPGASTSELFDLASKTEESEEEEDLRQPDSPSTTCSEITADEIELLCNLRTPGLSECDTSSFIKNDLKPIDRDSPEVIGFSSDSNISNGTSGNDYDCEIVKKKRESSREGSPDSPDYELHETSDITDSSMKGIKLEENVLENNKDNKEECKTPTVERKRKPAINILTPKRIHSHS